MTTAQTVRLSIGTVCIALGAVLFWNLESAVRAVQILRGGQHIAHAGVPKVVESIFLRLSVEQVAVPRSRPGTGGGLARFHDHLIAMPHDGTMFLIRDGEAVKLDITVPQNGLAALRTRASSEAYVDFHFNFGWMRYNDLLHVKNADQQALVLSYTEWNDTRKCYATAVAELALDPHVRDPRNIRAVAQDWEVIYRTRPCLSLKTKYRAIEGHMAGGRLAHHRSRHVMLSSGDYALDGVYGTERIAQSPDAEYGGVVEIDLDTGAADVLTRGQSNMQGIAVDAEDRVWTVEHGRRGGDELNLIERGRNFGWPEATYGTRYNRMPWPGSSAYGRHDGFDLPIFSWVPSVAISSLALIEGMHPAWDGDLIAGSLAGRALHRLRIREGRVIFAETIPVGTRIRAVEMMGDGRLALWTDDNTAILLEPIEQGLIFQQIEAMVADLDLPEATRKRVWEQVSACAECHTFSLTPGEHGPSLLRVWGRQVGVSDWDGYSGALAAQEGVWTETRLAAYIDDPARWAPGTSMPDPGIDDPRLLAGLATLLRRLEEDGE